jgi:hypothetical protein
MGGLTSTLALKFAAVALEICPACAAMIPALRLMLTRRKMPNSPTTASLNLHRHDDEL